MTSPFIASEPRGALRQCEILSSVIQRECVDVSSLGTSELFSFAITAKYAVILTQDCDLEQDFRVRFVEPKPRSDKLLTSILFGVVVTAADLFSASANNSRKQWERLNIEGNKNERFQFLEKAAPETDSAGQGLPELAIDFKQWFTVPTDELYRRIELGEAVRRCRLVSPYLEHLTFRFHAYHSRVALPTDHRSD